MFLSFVAYLHESRTLVHIGGGVCSVDWQTDIMDMLLSLLGFDLLLETKVCYK